MNAIEVTRRSDTERGFGEKPTGTVRRWLGWVAIGLVGAIWLCEFADGASADEPAQPVGASVAEKSFGATIASPEEIAQWISELGHDAFTVRQAAAAHLLAAGIAAREPLQAVVDGPDPETRAAARRLVALIEQSEFHRRLEAFAADTDGTKGTTLPGWDQYKKLVGGDPGARALFVDMQRQEGGLIAIAYGANRRSLNEVLEPRLMRLLQWQNIPANRGAAPPLASCAAMFFIGASGETEISDVVASRIEDLVQRPPVAEAVRTNGHQEAVRRLVVSWLVHCPSKNEQILLHRLSMIAQLGVEEGVPLAVAVIGKEPPYKRPHAYTLALAISIVGQLGHRADIERLEPLLDDNTVCLPMQMQLPGQPASTVQIRDVALMSMLQLTGQNPSEYGFANARLQAPFQVQTFFRESDQQRVEAIAKWRKWRAEHKDSAGGGKAN